MFRIVVIIMFLFANTIEAQLGTDSRHEVIRLLKEYKLEEAFTAIENMEDSFSKTIFEKELDYLLNGNLDYVDENLPSGIRLDKRDSVLFRMSLGSYQNRKIQPDHSAFFENYLSAFELAERLSDTLLVNESLHGLNEYFLRNHIDTLLYKKYVSQLSKYKQDKIDEFWQQYYSLTYEMSVSSKFPKAFKKLEKGFFNLEMESERNPYFLGKVQHMIGIYYSYPPYPKKSRHYFEKASKTYDSTFYYSNKRKISTQIALAVMDFRDKEYLNAITTFENSLENKFVKRDERLKSIIYDWLVQCYEQLPSNSKKALYYLKMKDSSENKMKLYAVVQKNREIEAKHQVIKKDESIKNLKTENKDLQDNLITIIPILGIISLLAIIGFVLFKRYKNRSSKLETEKSETLQKLDELKNIVIKNHIILKDKTKIYISDLMYVKSDDHYLNIFTSDDKSHFVRGKLSNIRQELPPNFIQCHRSYIVNSNFIKRVNNDSITLIDKTQIPLSRSYRNKF